LSIGTSSHGKSAFALTAREKTQPERLSEDSVGQRWLRRSNPKYNASPPVTITRTMSTRAVGVTVSRSKSLRPLTNPGGAESSANVTDGCGEGDINPAVALIANTDRLASLRD
jgi:hypothetical protein